MILRIVANYKDSPSEKFIVFYFWVAERGRPKVEVRGK
jgi:hypothetical protein